MDPFTAKNYQIGKAPKLIQLFGDKTKKVESAQHIIEFPGGAIEVSRTTDGDYWAHIIVNREHVIDDAKGLRSKKGTVINSRIDRHEGTVFDLDRQEEIAQIAVLVRSEDQ
jgi:hypothetical protein